MDQIIPEPHGLAPSILDWIGRLPQPVFNALAGKLSAAGRQTLDLAGDVIDAPLPGDWIPHLSASQDFTHPHDLLGVDPETSPGSAAALDLVGETLANPLTWVGGPALSAAGKGAKAALSVAPKGVQAAIGGAGQYVRKVTGNQRLADSTRDIRSAAEGAQGAVSSAAAPVIEDLARTTTPAMREALGMAFHGVAKTGHGPSPWVVIPGRTVNDRLQFLASHHGLDLGQLQAAADKIRALNKGQWESGQGTELGGRVFGARNDPTTGLPTTGTPDYLYRDYSGIETKAKPGAGSSPKATHARSLTEPADIADWLNKPENAGIDLNLDAVSSLGKRSEQQGRLAQQAAVGRGIEEAHGVGAGPMPAGTPAAEQPFIALANEGSSKRVQALIAEIARTHPEDAQVLTDLYDGLAPRTGWQAGLASLNRIFKKYAVAGAILPKLGTHISNVLSGTWQTAAGGGSLQEVGQYAKNIPATITNAVGRGARKAVEGTSLEPGVTNATGALDRAVSGATGATIEAGELDAIKAAFAQSGGDPNVALQLMPNDAAREAVKRGILGNNFVNSEELINHAPQTGWKKVGSNLMDYPSEMMQGTEQNMRYGAFKRMLQDGVDPETATREANSRYFDYNVSSQANRTARDIMPFFQFSAKAIPQSAEFLAKHPWLAVGLNQLSQSGSGNPIYPYMQGKTNIPIGKDEQGNDEYISGLRMPYEALSMIPNPSGDLLDFGREVEQNIIGSTQPALKSAYAYVSGHDPYFESAPGSYTQIPALGDSLGTGVGRAYHNLAGAGLIQPIDSSLRLIDQATDSRHSLPVKALDMLTGANVVSVDPTKALQQEVQSQLARDPDVQKYETYFQHSKDPETQAKIHVWQEAKKALRLKSKAAKAAQGEVQPDRDTEAVGLTSAPAAHPDDAVAVPRAHVASRDDVGVADAGQIGGATDFDFSGVHDHLPAHGGMIPDDEEDSAIWPFIPQQHAQGRYLR